MEQPKSVDLAEQSSATAQVEIESVETNLYHVPLATEMTDARHGIMRDFAVITVKIRTRDGVEGIGYSYTVGQTGGRAVHSLVADSLAPLITGADPRRIEHLWERMWWHVHYVGRGGIASFAISAVDTALWDLKAKLAGEPLWRLLGGHDPRVRVYAGGIDLELPLDDLLKKTETNLHRGFRAIKMKVGRARLREDVERVAAVRKLIGPDIPLMVDANMRWTVDQAIRASHAFAGHDVFWLEEPTIPDDVEGHRRIESEGPLPVAAGENLHTIYEFQKLMAVGGVSFPEPDLTNIGGVTGWMKVAHLAEAHNLPVTSHGVHDLHLSLLAAVPNPSYLEVHGFSLEKFMDRPFAIDDGVAIPANVPGHGVELNWDRLEAHRAG
ncbi:MAG: mandelate racemase/muconate lactonizing enzyme family protein [Bryobacteraceae bacterium]